MLHYLPGCDVKKNHQEAMNKIIAYMKSKGAQIEECCRTKTSLCNEGDLIVQNCTMCDLILKEVQKGNVMSLYEYVLNDETFPFVNFNKKRFVVQDCWRMKDNPSIHQAVRDCLKKMNIEIVELEEKGESSKFCGVWNLDHLTPIALEVAPETFNELERQVQVYTEKEKQQLMLEHAKQIHNNVVCYCNGCEKGLKMANVSVFHMVDLLARGL